PGPAEHPAPRIGHRPGIGLRGGGPAPVRLAAEDAGPGGRFGEFWPVGQAACLQQQHPRGRILAEAGGEYAPGRAAADDDEVVAAHRLPLPVADAGHRVATGLVRLALAWLSCWLSGSPGARFCSALPIASSI